MVEPPLPVAVIAKNSHEEVRVCLDVFHECDLIDVRTYADFTAGAVQCRGPTKKGVSLKIAKLPELIASLQLAKSEAQRRGLLPDDA